MTKDQDKIAWLSAELDRVRGNVETTLDALASIERSISVVLTNKQAVLSQDDRALLRNARDRARAIPTAIDRTGTAHDC